MKVLLHRLHVFRLYIKGYAAKKRPVYRWTGRKQSTVHSAGCANPAVLEEHITPLILTIYGGRLSAI